MFILPQLHFLKEILDSKSTITKMKNSLEGLNNRSELSEEGISEIKDRELELMQSEEQKE